MFARFPLVKQTDQSDCGAAALASVALHYRMPVALHRMRTLAGTDREGTNLLGLVEAAEKLGFSAKAAKGTSDSLADIPLPAIAHVKNNEALGHFVVLYRVSARWVTIADPAGGVEKIALDEFLEKWTGYLLLLVPDSSLRPTEAGQKPQRPLRRLVGLVQFYRSILLEALICAVLMTLLGISTSYFVQHLVDSVLVRGETRLLNALGLGMACVVIFRTLFGLLRQYLLAHIGRRVDLALISGYARHLLLLPMNFFEMHRVGEILSRVNDASRVRDAVSGATLTIIVDGAMVVAVTALLWVYDVQLAAIATVFAPLLVLTVLAHQPAAKRLSRQSMEDAAQHSAHLVEDISGVETIKAFGIGRLRADEGEDRLVKLSKSLFSLQKLEISMDSLSGIVSGLAGIAVLWYGGHRVIEGALTIGELMFFYTLLGYMLGPLERLASVNLDIQDALIAVDRLYQVMDLNTEDIDSQKASFTKLSTAVELRNVSFRYGCRDDVLKTINLRIPVGATVAVVGESGCGKSTLLKLLMRYHDPSDGQVSIDGVNLKDYDLNSIRCGVGLVSQDSFIFNGTLRENIALGSPGATFNDVMKAADDAGMTEFIATLPDRYDTIIGERGANLSGGQRQRLAIARALVRDPEMLFFDEATSHLDTKTEREIQDKLRTALVNKTVVVVAHRLSTIRDADVICVMRDGKISEQGTHDELIFGGGYYAKLWKSQTTGSGGSLQPYSSDPISLPASVG